MRFCTKICATFIRRDVSSLNWAVRIFLHRSMKHVPITSSYPGKLENRTLRFIASEVKRHDRPNVFPGWPEAAGWARARSEKLLSLSERQTSSADENDERNDKETSSRSGGLAQGDKDGARFYETSPPHAHPPPAGGSRAVVSLIVFAKRQTEEEEEQSKDGL